MREGVRVRERSRAKSSAAKMRPLRRGVLVQMEGRVVMARADSMRARMWRGFWEGVGEEEEWGEGEEGCRSGSRCLITSVRKCRSEGELHLGRTMASRLGEGSCYIYVAY